MITDINGLLTKTRESLVGGSGGGGSGSLLGTLDKALSLAQKFTGKDVGTEASSTIGTMLSNALAKVNLNAKVAVKIPDGVYVIGAAIVAALLFVAFKRKGRR